MKKILVIITLLTIGVFCVQAQSVKTIYNNKILVFTPKSKNVKFGSLNNASGDISFVLGGPTLGSNGKPIGAIMMNGKVIKSTSKRRLNKTYPFVYYNSVFGVDVGGNTLMLRQEVMAMSYTEMQWSFQNGPALVMGGVVPDLSVTQIPNINAEDYFSGIGYDFNGNIIVMVTLRKMTIKQFSFIFKNYGCRNAIIINNGPGVFYSINSSLYRNLKGSARISRGNSSSNYNFIFY